MAGHHPSYALMKMQGRWPALLCASVSLERSGRGQEASFLCGGWPVPLLPLLLPFLVNCPIVSVSAWSSCAFQFWPCTQSFLGSQPQALGLLPGGGGLPSAGQLNPTLSPQCNRSLLSSIEPCLNTLLYCSQASEGLHLSPSLSVFMFFF